MSDIKADIASKSTKNTGITADVARELYDRLGRTRVAIVEITSTEFTDGLNGPKSVKLELGFIETTNDEEVDNFLRELAQALYRERTPQKELTSLSDQEPKPADLITTGAGLYLVDPNLPPNPSEAELVEHAAALVVSTQFGSKSMLQRKLNISHDKAQELLTKLEDAAIVGPAEGTHVRDVLFTADRVDDAVAALTAEAV
jgi:DNA segregation ATPase FtsK/SpoIIIE-like protein